MQIELPPPAIMAEKIKAALRAYWEAEHPYPGDGGFIDVTNVESACIDGYFNLVFLARHLLEELEKQ